MFIYHQNTWRNQSSSSSIRRTSVVFSFLQSGPPWQEQNIVHHHVGSLTAASLCFAWHVTRHEHLINFSKSIGASKVSAGTVVGLLSTLDPSSLDHPNSVGFRTGGFGSNQTATWRWALATFSLNTSLVGGTLFVVLLWMLSSLTDHSMQA